MSQILKYLRGWIGVVAVMALGNSISCFRGHQFLADRLYTGAVPDVNGLMARLFGVWTLLSACLRFYCALEIKNKALYNLTFISFILALGHFLTEAYIYGTAPITVGVIAPLAVSSVSIVWMIIGYQYLDCADSSKEAKTRSRDIPKPRGKKAN